jgi:virulence factor
VPSDLQPLRIGIVGAGKIAQIAELPALSAAPGITIAGVVTEHLSRATDSLLRWPIERAYETTEQMIDGAQLDALFVLTPKNRHTPFVEQGLRAGLDVFCEKPLATSLTEAQRMAALSDEVNKILMVDFNRRYAEVYQTAHEQVADRPVRFAVAQKNRPGSEYRATLENAIHMVDLLRWFCGEAIDVTGHSYAPDPYKEEGAAAMIRFDTGATGVLVAARCAGDWDERLDLYGDLTSVRVVAPDSVAVSREGQSVVTEMRPRAMGWADITTTAGFAPAVHHFLDCVRTRRTPLTNGHEAARSQELMDRVLSAVGLPQKDDEMRLAAMAR